MLNNKTGRKKPPPSGGVRSSGRYVCIITACVAGVTSAGDIGVGVPGAKLVVIDVHQVL
jgi:hypothetical protein